MGNRSATNAVNANRRRQEENNRAQCCCLTYSLLFFPILSYMKTACLHARRIGDPANQGGGILLQTGLQVVHAAVQQRDHVHGLQVYFGNSLFSSNCRNRRALVTVKVSDIIWSTAVIAYCFRFLFFSPHFETKIK